MTDATNVISKAHMTVLVKSAEKYIYYQINFPFGNSACSLEVLYFYTVSYANFLKSCILLFVNMFSI